MDDFSNPNLSLFGTTWEGFTDRVMGGLSQMQSGIVVEGGQSFLRMAGRVRVENNGGFIQMRLGLKKAGKNFDARSWTGVRLLARADPGSYSVHLRTAQTLFPWNFYTAPIQAETDWTEIRIPFSRFKGDYGAIGKPDLRRIKGIAVVAIGKAFDAKLELKEIGFYR